MKIGIFCDSFFPENKAVAIRLFHLVDAFSACRGVQVVVHSSTANAIAPKPEVVTRRNRVKAPSNTASNAKRLFSELVLGLEMFFRVLFSSYDLILFTSPPFFASTLGVVAARLRGIKYIFDVRDEYPEVFFTWGIVRKDSLAGRCLLEVEKFIYRNAFRLITVTEGICKRIDRKINSQDHTLLVRNGFDDRLFQVKANREQHFTVVFHGNLGKFQDPKLIVSLARKAAILKKPIRFKIIGFGSNEEILSNARLDNLEFLGMVDYADIPGIISRAHLGISFRTNETISANSFPVKLYEYIGVGIPVIVTPVSEAGHFFEANQIGFQFNPDQEDLILAKIIELSENKDLLELITNRIISLRDSFSRQRISSTFATEVIRSLKDFG